MRGLSPVSAIALLLLHWASWSAGQDSIPQNFALSLNGTVLTASWDAPADQTVSSYNLTCSAGNNVLSVETSLTEVTVGIYMTETTYSCTVYATVSGVDGSPTSSVSVTTGDSSVAAYLPFVPRLSDDNVLNTGDDFTTSVTIVNFPLGTTSSTSLYVGSNGIISFGTAYNPYVNSAFTSSTGRYAVAPFWDDINIGSGGTISYETFESGYYLEQVNAYIQRTRPTTFEGTWMMNVYYKEVAPYGGTEANTFQAILVTDETYSYVIFIYKCGLMEWDNVATIGYTINGNPFDNHNPSSNEVACVNSPNSDWNNVLYRLSANNPEDPSPEDISISQITETSANVAWTIASVSSQQEYNLKYGEDSNNLDQTTAVIQGDSDTTLTDESYDIDLTDLTRDTTYYVQVLQTIGDITISSDVVSFDTLPAANPEDLTATEITGTSATIGWTVEYISVEQDYVVNYGTSEDNLDQTSDTVPSVTDTSLTNQEYSVTLTDLSAGTMYYYQVVATFETTTVESDTASFTTLELAPSGAPVLFAATLTDTVLSFTWDPPAEDQQNGEIVSYFLSCSISNNVEFELNLTDIEEISVGVYKTVSTYTCEIYAATSAGGGPTASQTVTTGNSATSAYLPFIPLGVRYSQSNKVFLTQADDRVSPGISIPIDFPFSSSVQSTVYVGSNGLISFGTSGYNPFSNTNLPGNSGRYFIAPFWDDINTNNGGETSYETFQSSYFLDQVNAFLNRKRPIVAEFEGTWMMVAYYDDVAPLSGSTGNTFQVIIITDGTYTYTIFTYKCGLMEWDNGVTIGYSAAGDPYENHDPSSSDVACVNSPNSDWNNVLYLISGESPEEAIPHNVTASEVTATTATISWVIAFIVEQQDFIVYYGTDENSLDLTSDIVTSSDDTSLTDQEYDVTLTGLTLGTTYYYQVVANYSNFRLESEIKDFTTLELAPSGSPVNFTATLTGTVLLLEWAPPEEDDRNGDIISYFLSCSFNDNEMFELNLTDINEIYLGVYRHEATYSCDIYASTSAGGGPTASASVTTGAYSTTAYLPFIPLGVLYEESNEINLPASDDVISSQITLPTDFPFASSTQTTAYVGSNGLISFGSGYNSFQNTVFPVTSRYLIAPFWDDINIANGGVISYETFESGYFVDKVNDFIQRRKPTSFEGTWMMVASYDKVQPYSGSGENTFQAIIISDGTYSYIIFTYKCDLMNWENGATIGYNAAGDPYDNYDDPSPDEVDCVNSPDSNWNNVIYQLSEDSPEDPPAENVTISNITDSSAVVSWTVSSISSPQEYTVEYGNDEDNLNETSDTIAVSDTSLTDQTYNTTLTGLTQGVLYHLRVATTNAGNVTFYSDTKSFRTVESAPTGPPRNFVVTVENTSLRFEWDPPADDKIGGTLISYTLTCSDTDDENFEVELKVIGNITLDEFLPSTAYTCTIFASTNGGDGPTASVTATTDDTTEVYLRFLKLDALLGVEKVVATAADDAVTGPISIDPDFPFGDSNQMQFYVGTNGIISFGTSGYNPYINSIFPVSGRYVVTPFWDDIDTRSGNGRISYEIHDSGHYLDQVSTFLARKRPSGFQGTWMAVIFYDAVRPYPAASNTEENSFQVILITDGTYSYAIFTYNCDLMEWDNGATIGFSAGSNFYANHDPSSSDVACLNRPDSDWSNVVYRLSSDSPELSPPSEIELSILRTDSVNVTWTIPSFVETEEYVIEYGLKSDNLNLTSSSVDSSTDTSLVNQTYSVVLDDLKVGTIYYMRVLAQYGYQNLYKRYSDVVAFRTLEEEQTKYLPFLNHTDTYVSNGTLDSCDDCTSENITLPSDFPFWKYIHQNAYIGTDGWISFGRTIDGSDPELFPTETANVFWTFVVAPFWGNLSTSERGMVSWEIHNSTLSSDLVTQVSNFIQEEYGDENFNGTWMIIGFWEDVATSGESSSNNTFQAILITNGTKSYAVFTYKCKELEYSNVAVIGYNAPLGPYKNHPLSNADVEADTIACVHLDSVWNNVIYDLQPNGSIVFSVPPEPSDFIGSCEAAGYTECCTDGDCSGEPDDCYCDAACRDTGDCCYDLDAICPNGTADEYDVLVANGQYIHQVYFEGGDAITLTNDLFETVSGIDFIYNSSVMFWSDIESDKIYRANLNGSNVEELINSSILAVDDVAVDWISNKLYWVDAVWARIEVMDLDSLYRAEVLRVGPNTLPRAIAVDPESRFMFWTDWSDTAKIERSFMDGNDRRTIISTSLSQPNGITVDYISEKIYWSDSGLNKIEYANYDGTSRTTLLTAANGLSYPFSLTVANNFVFWGDWDTNKVYATHKVHGSDADDGYFATVALFSFSPYGVEAILSSRQQSAENPCSASNCSHICLLNDLENGFSCVCAEGYGILSNGRSCKKLDETELPPSEGSCVEAGYNNSDTCCESGHCSGYPATCSCDLECYERGDCCSDISDACTEGTPVVPTDVSVQDITRDSGNVSWIISNVAITQESYSVNYGVNMSDLEMSSESISSRGESLTNQTYSVVLEDLASVTKYYYQVVSENDFSSSTSDIYSFTTLEGVPAGAPVNFTIDVNLTTLICSWAPPPADLQDGNITSYTLFCLVDDEIVFNETLSSSVESFEINLYALATTYNCSIYASTDVGDGPASDYVNATTTDSSDFLVVLPFISISDTYNFDVVTLSETDDGGSDEISIPDSIGFPFGDSSQSSVFIGTNGLISFGSFYNSFSNQEFPGGVSTRNLVAPFWDDVDIRGGNGEISYEIHDSGYYLDHVSGFVRAVKPSEFQGTWMLMVYWDAVHPYLGSSNSQENTFQAVLVTDGNYSYTVFTYMCGLMEWDRGATIGFNAASGRYANNDPSSSDVACVNSPESELSNVIYRLSDDDPEYPSPDNVEVSEITEESAAVSWTVEYVIEQQEYYLVYGVDEDALNLTSRTVQGNPDTSLTNQTYNITLNGLTFGTEYYVIVTAVYGFTTLYSDTVSFTTIDQAPNAAPLNYKVVPRGTGLYFRWDDPNVDVNILSYTIVCYISSDLAINVTLNPVNSVILDEFMPSTTYTCSMYASSSGGAGPSTASISVTTEDDTGDIYLPFLSLDALYGVDQIYLDRTDDGTSDLIDVEGINGFPFGDSVQTQLYVGTNGLLSFGTAYNSFTSQAFPGSSTISFRYLVAPFWDDIDISRDENGQISYEIHQSGYYLDQVNDFLLRKRPSSFNATWMFVAYWDSVRPYPGSSSSLENSFQAILITDGTYSYSIFTYNCNVTEWGSSGVTIGYSAAGDPYDNYDPSSSAIACLNTPDSNYTNVIYLLSDDNPELPPPDFTELEVVLTSVNISWTITYFNEEEEYYIIYGFESDDLDETSDSIMSVSNTSLENQTYTIHIEGLDAATIYFAKVVAVFGASGEFKRYSDTFVFRTKENGQTVYLEFLPHTDTSTNNGTLESCDNCSSAQISLPDNIPFGGYFHDTAYLSSNGLISFGRSFTSSDPQLFPSTTSDVFWRYIAAVFWADWHTLTSGTASWEVHTRVSSQSLIELVDNLIQEEYGDANFTGSWMLVGFWENVTDSDELIENTFQEILITNGTKSYAVYTYKCGELEWKDSATIGYNAPPEDYYNHPLTGTDIPPDEIACVHLNSVWNNVIIDLEPNPVILPTTPEPSRSIGSCAAAGFTECCASGCSGSPSDCYCDVSCRVFADCCYDIDDTCPQGNTNEYDILVANGFYIHQVHFQGNDSDTIRTNSSDTAVGIDFHYEDNLMFWSDIKNDVIYRAGLDGMQEEILVDSNIDVVDDIAVDWVSNKLYWVDAVWARIEVMDLDSLYRAEVLRVGPNTNPRAIAVEPDMRFLFWTDWGENAKIEQSFMDGSNRRTVISSDLSQPNGITVDYTSQKIYWSDSDLDKIEYSNYDGSNRMSVETEDTGLLYPFSLTVAGDILFWSDWGTNTIYATHKQHGAETSEGYFAPIAVFTSIPYGIEALDGDRQTSADNTCDGNNCSHICLMSDIGYTCVCPDGYSLESDGLECKVDNTSGSGGAPLEGSCVDAGYNDSCCQHGYCAGYPFTCFCDRECYDRGDCCDDIEDVCPEGAPVAPTNVIVTDITGTSAVISWTIPYVAFTFEQYRVNYGLNSTALSMMSDVVYGVGVDAVNATYSVSLSALDPLTTYYFQVVASNSESFSTSAIMTFTSGEDVPSGPPVSFSITVDITSLMCSWNQPAEDQRNGEIISYALICTTDSETVIDITLNPSATEITLDLFAPLTSYSCSVAASTAVGIGPYTTPINVTTEALDTPNNYLRFIPLNAEYGSSTIVLPESDDGTSNAILLPESIVFPFGSSIQTQFYVGTNGLISFGSPYNSFANQPFPGSVSSNYLVAPFWDDVDIRGGNGIISYEIYDSGYFLDHVSAFVRQQRPSNFQGTWMAVVYWDEVHPYFGATSTEENSYQAVLITDGSYSYTVFTYRCGLLEWGNGATIGFNAPGENFDNHDPSYPDIACLNQPISDWSNIVYLLSNDSTEFEIPRDVIVSNITMNSANVSWIVPSVTEPQEYYVLYGVNQIILNLTTDKVQGNSDTSLLNQSYSTILQDLDYGTTYYLLVVTEFGSTTLYSEMISFTTIEPAPDGPPLNFTVSVDGVSLSFSWKPPAGDVEILSYTVSCLVGGVTEINAQLNSILAVTLDELTPSTNYSCSVYASSSGGDGPPTDPVLVTTESVIRNEVYLPFIPMDASYGVEEIFLPESDDGTSGSISIPIPFPFGQSIQNQFFVGTNGLLSFGSSYNSFSNQVFPDFVRYLVAPFWDDVDTRGGNGRISYEIHQSGYFLEQVNTYLKRKRPSDFQGTWMAITYWDAVHPYFGASNTDENTFQAILITDGTYTYTIFIYKCGLMEWDNGATIGFNAAGNSYANNNPSTADVACLNTPYTNWSNVEFLLSNASPEIPVPQNVTASERTTTSATISWTIPSFVQPEEYYVEYGTEPTALDMTTASIASVTDTSLVNQMYSISLQSLSSGTVYYVRVAAVFDELFARYSDIVSFRTYDEEQVVYLPFLNHTDTNINSGSVESCDDCSSPEIVLPRDFPFGGYLHQTAYVGTNGLISFGRTVSNSIPELFPTTSPDVYWSYVIAPFWADFNTALGGEVSWEIHNSMQSPDLLGQVNMFIQTLKGVNFTGTWMLVGFWEEVDANANNFQAIIITDDVKSYSVYTYKCGELVWPESATIGFNAPFTHYSNDPLSGNTADQIACVHLLSPWNNIVYDLQPGSILLPTTPAPSDFIGSCVAAEYTECCEGASCLGFPADCYCDNACLDFGDCCYDFLDICPNTTAPLPYDLLVGVGPSLATIHYQGSDSSIVRTNYSENTLAVDFDFAQSKVYWSHTELGYYTPATIYRANLDGTDEEVLVNTNLLVVSDIAVDWIAGNLYWVDSSWARIEAMDLYNLNRTEILRTGANTNPSAIAVDPLRRYMFWSDLGEIAQIERAFLDGGDRRVILNTDLSQPVGITVDYSEQRIYWSDVDLNRLEFCNFDGNGRAVVETEASGLLYPYALTVANDLLFWTDWVTDSVYATHKEHGSNIDNGYFQTVATFSSDPYGIEALLKNRQESGVNYCENSTCTHICLLSGTDVRGYICVCPEGYQLEPDGFSCKANDSVITPPDEGSCAAAGYSSCCTHGYCAGYPPTCFCRPDCILGTLGCCSDFTGICPSVPPVQPTNLIASVVYSTSAQVTWTILNVVFGFETYYVSYGLTPDNLDVYSDTPDGGPSVQNATYSIILENLQPLTTYYYRVTATNLAGDTLSEIESFTTQAAPVTTTQTEQTSQTTTTVASTSTLAVTSAMQSQSQTTTTVTSTSTLAVTSSTQSQSQTTTTVTSTSTLAVTSAMQSQLQPSVSSTTVSGTTQLVTPSVTSQTQGATYSTTTRVVVPTTVATTTQTGTPSESTTLETSTATEAPTSIAQSQAPSESVTIATSSTPAPPSETPSTTSSQQLTSTTTTVPVAPPSTTRISSAVPSTGPPVQSTPTTSTTSPSSSSETTQPTETPIETKIPSVIEENSIKITLMEYDAKTFTASVQQNFKMATAEVVTACCVKDSCQTFKLKRATLEVMTDDVAIVEILDSSSGVTFLTYVLIDGTEVLNGASLLACIQNATDSYKAYGFGSVTAEYTGESSTKQGGLSDGAIAGVVIAVLLVVVAILATAAFILYRLRKRGLYKVSRLVGGYDDPVTDRFFEFDSNASDDDMKKNPLFEEEGL